MKKEGKKSGGSKKYGRSKRAKDQATSLYAKGNNMDVKITRLESKFTLAILDSLSNTDLKEIFEDETLPIKHGQIIHVLDTFIKKLETVENKSKNH